MARKPKSTKAAVIDRVSFVRELLLEGHTRKQIIRATASWERSPRQIDKYIRKATDEIREVTAADAETLLAKLTANLWDLYRRNITFRPSTSRLALMDIAKLNGLDKLEITLKIRRDHEKATDDELDQALGGSPC